jgi:hypothetical protein
MREIAEPEVKAVMDPWVWDVATNTLYDLCRRHPTHTTIEEIIGKVLLIGRSNAAAIERRRRVDLKTHGITFSVRQTNGLGKAVGETSRTLPQSAAQLFLTVIILIGDSVRQTLLMFCVVPLPAKFGANFNCLALEWHKGTLNGYQRTKIQFASWSCH